MLDDGTKLPVGALFWLSSDPAVANATDNTLTTKYVLQEQFISMTGYYLYQDSDLKAASALLSVTPISPTCPNNCDTLIAQSGTAIGPKITLQVGKPFTIAYPMKRMDKSQPLDIYIAFTTPQGQRFFASPTSDQLQNSTFSTTRTPYLRYDGSQLWADLQAVLFNIESFPTGFPTGDYNFYAVQVPAGTLPPDDPAAWTGSKLLVTIPQ